MSFIFRLSLVFALIASCDCALAQEPAPEGAVGAFRLPAIDDAPVVQEELPKATEVVESPTPKETDAKSIGLPSENIDTEPYFLSPWFDAQAWDPWDGNVELGLNGTDGNSETFNVRFGATAKHKGEVLERTLQITSIQKTANGITTANTALIDGRFDWPLKGSSWNYFMHGLAEFDEFKSFDYRLSADTGFGYEFIQNDITVLIGRAGLAGSQEFGGPQDGFHPEFLFGGEYKRQFNETNRFSAKVDYYPSMEGFSDFRVNSQASWEIVLAKDWGMSLKFSLIDRYDSTPHTSKANDVDYSTLLLWSF